MDLTFEDLPVKDPAFREGSLMVSYGGHKVHVLVAKDGVLETPCGMVPTVGDVFFRRGKITCRRCLKSVDER